MDKFLETYTLPRLNYEEIENLNRPIISRDCVNNQKIPNKEKPGQDGFTSEFYQIFSE